jgi:ABC-type sugar transport system substrate-binding protein
MKTAKILLSVLVALVFVFSAVGCGAKATPTAAPKPAAKTTSGGYVIPVAKCAPNCTYKDMTVGFIQTGSESGWRAANTSSFKETATQQGVTLKFYDAQNKIENQVSAFHQFNQDPPSP